MKVYCAGFLFNRDMSQVVLIRKDHPDWQKGKLNAVGGHIESDETPAEAMEREFREETGLEFGYWQELALLSNRVPPSLAATSIAWQVHFFYRVCIFNETPKIPLDAKTCKEPVAWYPVEHTADRLPNLRWLIPMAISMGRGEEKASNFRILEAPSKELQRN